jgi:hypothetical protein
MGAEKAIYGCGYSGAKQKKLGLARIFSVQRVICSALDPDDKTFTSLQEEVKHSGTTSRSDPEDTSCSSHKSSATFGGR